MIMHMQLLVRDVRVRVRVDLLALSMTMLVHVRERAGGVPSQLVGGLVSNASGGAVPRGTAMIAVALPARLDARWPLPGGNAGAGTGAHGERHTRGTGRNLKSMSSSLHIVKQSKDS